MVKHKHDNFLSIVALVVGTMIVMGSLANLLMRIITGLCGLSLINYGLRLRGLPPLQVLIPMILSRRRFF